MYILLGLALVVAIVAAALGGIAFARSEENKYQNSHIYDDLFAKHRKTVENYSELDFDLKAIKGRVDYFSDEKDRVYPSLQSSIDSNERRIGNIEQGRV